MDTTLHSLISARHRTLDSDISQTAACYAARLRPQASVHTLRIVYELRCQLPDPSLSPTSPLTSLLTPPLPPPLPLPLPLSLQSTYSAPPHPPPPLSLQLDRRGAPMVVAPRWGAFLFPQSRKPPFPQSRKPTKTASAPMAPEPAPRIPASKLVGAAACG